MTAGLITPQDAFRVLRYRFLDGWIVIAGDIASIDSLEWEIYTPDTDKNEDFELLTTMQGPLFIGRKTLEFRSFLKLTDGEWDSLIILLLRRPLTTGKTIAETKLFNGPNKARMFEELAKKLVYGEASLSTRGRE